MSDTVIRVENLGKKYIIGQQANGHRTRDVLAGLRYDRSLIIKVLKESDMLEESVIYQDIFQKGKQQGVEQGVKQGVEQGVKQGREAGSGAGREKGGSASA